MAPRSSLPPPNLDADAPIVGAPVPPLVPSEGSVHTLLYGEAPGRQGADKSGVPFVGDGAGERVFAALVAEGAIEWPAPLETLTWTGAALKAAGILPVPRGIMLSNAWDRCPRHRASDTRIRPPTRAELHSLANLERLRSELALAHARGLRQVVTMGRVAADLLALLVAEREGVALVPFPHPSAQGLLRAAPGNGKGLRLADLASAWNARLEAVVRAGMGG